MKDIIILLKNINYTLIVFITLLINLCLSSNNNNNNHNHNHNNKHKKFSKKYIHNNNAYINNNTNDNDNGKNELISISPISTEKLQKYFWKLEQLPYIDDLCHDECKLIYLMSEFIHPFIYLSI
ncbi:unnamed protein product [Trichobilharzia regenti]|nr:unnamed protein product [Trichobilharzia regenti]